MTYIIYDKIPVSQIFLPFGDNFGTSLSPYCGQRLYTINEGYPFVKITPPLAGAEFTDDWLITVYTKDLSRVGKYLITIVASQTDYPSVLKA